MKTKNAGQFFQGLAAICGFILIFINFVEFIVKDGTFVSFLGFLGGMSFLISIYDIYVKSKK